MSQDTTAIVAAETAAPQYFFNVVFEYRENGIPRHGYTTVKMDVLIEYGTDLQALRQRLCEVMGTKDLVIVHWYQLKGVHRPDDRKPSIEIQPRVTKE